MGIRILHRRTVLPTGVVPALSAPVPAVAVSASTAQTPPAARGSGRVPRLAAPASRDAGAAPVAQPDSPTPRPRADGAGATCDLASECQYDYDMETRSEATAVGRTALRSEWLRHTLDRWEIAALRPLVTVTDCLGALRLPDVVAGSRSLLRTRALGTDLVGHARGEARRPGPGGTPGGPGAHRENGPPPRPAQGWRVHSVGAFTGTGRTCRIVVLSHDNPTTAHGARTIGRFARAVHRGLGQGRGRVRGPAPRSGFSGVQDGSAPYAWLPGRDDPGRDATP
ncbi:hypothetical protein ABZV34_18370 [Streptomyces sp. NPDC005195]|uniref:hypothetical protein n=1 Tax=Streptomyces sp. NPDC005195 TaxID=3154561 RepID=UPI0033A6F1A0